MTQKELVSSKVSKEQREEIRRLYAERLGYSPSAQELDLALIWWIRQAEKRGIPLDEMIERRDEI